MNEQINVRERIPVEENVKVWRDTDLSTKVFHVRCANVPAVIKMVAEKYTEGEMSYGHYRPLCKERNETPSVLKPFIDYGKIDDDYDSHCHHFRRHWSMTDICPFGEAENTKITVYQYIEEPNLEISKEDFVDALCHPVPEEYEKEVTHTINDSSIDKMLKELAELDSLELG